LLFNDKSGDPSPNSDIPQFKESVAYGSSKEAPSSSTGVGLRTKPSTLFEVNKPDPASKSPNMKRQASNTSSIPSSNGVFVKGINKITFGGLQKMTTGMEKIKNLRKTKDIRSFKRKQHALKNDWEFEEVSPATDDGQGDLLYDEKKRLSSTAPTDSMTNMKSMYSNSEQLLKRHSEYCYTCRRSTCATS
jgi:hypothetical protein